MPLAHLHPIIVHFTLTLGIGWCGWDLFWIFSRNQTGKSSGIKSEQPLNLLEGLIILLIITVCTGWIALSMKERSMGPGAAFPPGDNHGDAALLTLFILLTRFLIGQKSGQKNTNKQKNVFPKSMAPFFSFLALASFLVTGILGERLVFHYGVTAKNQPSPNFMRSTLPVPVSNPGSDPPDPQAQQTPLKNPDQSPKPFDYRPTFDDGSMKRDVRSSSRDHQDSPQS